MSEVYYRYVDHPRADGGANVTLLECEVQRRTKCGAWVWDSLWNRERFVLNDGGRFAHPTEEGARKSFRIRKRWQIKHLKRKLGQAEAALQLEADGFPEQPPEYDGFVF